MSCAPTAPYCRSQPQGLAFVKRRKVGALLGVTKERVVLVGKTHGPDGTPVWSGPVFVKANSVSLGFTAGELFLSSGR